MYSWGGREEKLAKLSAGDAKVDTATVEQSIPTVVPPNTPA